MKYVIFISILLSFLLISCDVSESDSESDDSIPAIPYTGISFSWSQEVIPSFSAGDTAIVQCIIEVDSLNLILDTLDVQFSQNGISGRENIPAIFERVEEYHTSHSVQIEISETHGRYLSFIGLTTYTIPPGEANGNEFIYEVRFISTEYFGLRSLSAVFTFLPFDSTEALPIDYFTEIGNSFDAKMNP